MFSVLFAVLPALVMILICLEITYLTPSRYCYLECLWQHTILCILSTNGDQVSSEDSTIKKLEFEFHSASYLTLLEAVQAMKNVLGHLINFIKVIIYIYTCIVCG